MTDTTEFLTTVADWFVMRGGEVVYDGDTGHTDDDSDPDEWDCERPAGWPTIHRVHLGDLQIFVGEPTETFTVDCVAEVGWLMNSGIPLPEAVVDAEFHDVRRTAPEFIEFEAIDEGDGVSAWAVIRLGRARVDDGSFVLQLEQLLAFADTAEARDICG